MQTFLRWPRQNINQGLHSQKTPHIGELWDVFGEDFGENWSRYDGTALYLLQSCGQFVFMDTAAGKPGDINSADCRVKKGYICQAPAGKEHYMFVMNIDGLVQDCSISSAIAMEILQSCIKPSIQSVKKNVPSRCSR